MDVPRQLEEREMYKMRRVWTAHTVDFSLQNKTTSNRRKMSAKIAVFILALMVCSFGLISAKSLEPRDQSEKALRSSDNEDNERTWFLWVMGDKDTGDQSEKVWRSSDNEDNERTWFLWVMGDKDTGDQSEEASHSFDDNDLEKGTF
uniref:uncharacterized protein LOC120336745 isoform X2 n=1 Tax=Styela clava TaxID=7725 RepID=UPI0019392A0E|nr:uncharacterized protein LOC120336745 isoform X2 [Styela clava]XP_039260437.1 uncharacterized protein LOC120336745 isoform X2 [Styela clava]